MQTKRQIILRKFDSNKKIGNLTRVGNYRTRLVWSGVHVCNVLPEKTLNPSLSVLVPLQANGTVSPRINLCLLGPSS